MPSTLANRAKMTVSGTPGTGTITLGSAVSGYQSFSAALGASATYTVSYTIEDGSSWEVGTGTYTTSGTTLTRTVTASSNGGSAISATIDAIVFLTALAADIVVKNGSLGTPSSGTLTNCTDLPSSGVTGLAASATTDTTNASNISSGTLAVARGGTGATTTTGSGANVLDTSPSFTTSALFPDGTASAPSIAHAGDTNCGLWFPAADTIAASTSGTERIRIDSSGNITNSAQPTFLAAMTNNGDQTYGTNTVTLLPFNVQVFKKGGGTFVNTSGNYYYQVPVTGYYFILAQVYGTASAGDATMGLRLYKNGADTGTYGGDVWIGTAAGKVQISPIQIAVVLYLSANDKLDIRGTAYNDTKNFRVFTGVSTFMVTLLG